MNSSIHGIGLFAKNAISKGTRVWEYNPLFDIVLDESQIGVFPKVARDFLDIYAYRALSTNELILNLDHAKHMNHADKPNLVPDEASNYHAAEDIPAGTELTCDYRAFMTGGIKGF